MIFPRSKVSFLLFLVAHVAIHAMDRDYNDYRSLLSINEQDSVEIYSVAQIKKYGQAMHALEVVDSFDEVKRVRSEDKVNDPEWVKNWLEVTGMRLWIVSSHRPRRKVDENPLISDLRKNMAYEFAPTFKAITEIHDIFNDEFFDDTYSHAKNLAGCLPWEDIGYQKKILEEIKPYVEREGDHNYFYAQLHDKIARREGRLLTYGELGYLEPIKTWFFPPNETERIGRFIPFALADPEHVEQVRRSIGLEDTLAERSEKFKKVAAFTFKPYLHDLNDKQVCDHYFELKEKAKQ